MSALSAYRIGRDQSCDIVLDDASVSREHAELRVPAEGPIEFVDLGSTNGIAVRGKGKWETVGRAVVERDEKIRVGLVVGKVADLLAAAKGARFVDAPPPAPDAAAPHGRSFLGRLLGAEHGRVVMRRDGTRPAPIEDRHEPSLHLPPIHGPGARAADADSGGPAAAMPYERASAPDARASAPAPAADPPTRLPPAYLALNVTPKERPAVRRAGLPVWGALPPWGKAAAVASVLAVGATFGATAYLDRRETARAPAIVAAAPAEPNGGLGPGAPPAPANPPSALPTPPAANPPAPPKSADVPPTAPFAPPKAEPGRPPAPPGDGPRARPPAPAEAAGPVARVAWHRLVDGPRHSHIAAATATADGGLCLAGEGTLPGSGGTEGWVVRLDAGGRTLWQRRPGHPGRDGATAVLATPDGGCIAAGYAADERRLWLFKLDRAGRQVWERLIPAGARGRVAAIARDRDGGFAIAALWRPGFEAPDRTIVMRFSPDGQLRFSQNFGLPGTSGADLRATPDGGLVVVGLGRVRAEERPALWVLRLARDGRVAWERTYPAPGTPSGALVRIVRDGQFLIAAAYGPPALAGTAPGPGPALRLLRLDAQGQPRADERVHVGVPRLVGLAPFKGGLWLAGEASGGRGETWLGRFDAAGRLIEERRYQAGAGDRLAALVERADGRLALAATAGDPARRGAAVLYLDRAGRLDP